VSQKTADFNDKNQSPTQKMPTAFFVSDLDRRQATGDRRQATGDRRQATGDRRQATGDRRQATGDRRQALYTSSNKSCQLSNSIYLLSFYNFLLIHTFIFSLFWKNAGFVRMHRYRLFYKSQQKEF